VTAVATVTDPTAAIAWLTNNWFFNQSPIFVFTDKAHSLTTFLTFLCNAWDLFDEMPEPKNLFYSKIKLAKVL
jgi:hypothetical protein